MSNLIFFTLAISFTIFWVYVMVIKLLFVIVEANGNILRLRSGLKVRQFDIH